MDNRGRFQENSPWQNAKFAARCRELWDADKSAAYIANLLNAEFVGFRRVSRNAILGHADRADFPSRKRKPRGTGKPNPPRTRTRFSINKLNYLLREVKIEKPSEVLIPLAVPFLEITDHQCREILNERGNDGLVLFCGHPQIEGCSYCATHAKINYHIPQQLSEAERERRRQQARNNNARTFAG